METRLNGGGMCAQTASDNIPIEAWGLALQPGKRIGARIPSPDGYIVTITMLVLRRGDSGTKSSEGIGIIPKQGLHACRILAQAVQWWRCQKSKNRVACHDLAGPDPSYLPRFIPKNDSHRMNHLRKVRFRPAQGMIKSVAKFPCSSRRHNPLAYAIAF